VKRETIACPACGKRAIVEVSETMRKKSFDCPCCECRFSLVFNRDLIIDEAQRSHALAEDYPG